MKWAKWTLGYAVLVLSIVGVPRAMAQNTALLIGNSNYAPPCSDLPGDVFDVLRKHNALENAGWTVVNRFDLNVAQMKNAIAANVPPAGNYIVWFSGHGAQNGDLLGSDCNPFTPKQLVNALGAAVDRTLVILDSCYSGNFANAANALAPGLGFITATSKGECAAGAKTGSTFTTCFVDGLNGLADGADGSSPNGVVTVAEAAAYATTTCTTDSQPTWDGDYGTWVIGQTKTGAVSCWLNGQCIDNISPTVCTNKGGQSNPDPCGTGCCIFSPTEHVNNVSETACTGKGGQWHSEPCNAIPTVSEWGLVAITLLVLAAGTVVLLRRRQQAAA